MTERTRPNKPGWHALTVALIVGLAVASGLFFLIAAIGTPGLDPPPETAALFLVATTVSVVSYRLLHDWRRAGQLAAIVTGAVVLLVVAIIVAGTYGPAGPRTNPIGPLAYVLLAVAAIVTAGLSWRTESGRPPGR